MELCLILSFSGEGEPYKNASFKTAGWCSLKDVEIHRDVRPAPLEQTVVAHRKHKEAVFTTQTWR